MLVLLTKKPKQPKKVQASGQPGVKEASLYVLLLVHDGPAMSKRSEPIKKGVDGSSVVWSRQMQA